MGKILTSQRKHTRVKYSPLDYSCALVCLTPASPLAQAIDTLASVPEYNPDRTVTPTVLAPVVRVTDKDRVFAPGPICGNQYLSADRLEWYVDGKPIAEQWSAAEYSIDTTKSDTRGALTIKKNFAASEKVTLTFKSQFNDWRTNLNYAVESNEVLLTCTDKGRDAYSCTIDKPFIVYDPLYDKLFLYDYKIANNISVQVTRASQKDDKSFEQEVKVTLISGMTECAVLPHGVTMRIVELNNKNNVILPNSAGHPELVSVNYPYFNLDLRMVDKAEYEIQFLEQGKIVATVPFSVRRDTSLPTLAQPMFGADIAPHQEMYYNQVAISLAGTQADLYPELYYAIKWFTQGMTKNGNAWQPATEKEWQTGKGMAVRVLDLGIGSTSNDSMFDVWFTLEPQAPLKVTVDEQGNIVTDERGDLLII